MNKSERGYLQSMIRMYSSRIHEGSRFEEFYYHNRGALDVLKHFAEQFGVEVPEE